MSPRIFEALDCEAHARGISLLACARLVESLARLDGLSPVEVFCFGTDAGRVAEECRELIHKLAE